MTLLALIACTAMGGLVGWLLRRLHEERRAQAAAPLARVPFAPQLLDGGRAESRRRSP